MQAARRPQYTTSPGTRQSPYGPNLRRARGQSGTPWRTVRPAGLHRVLPRRPRLEGRRFRTRQSGSASVVHSV